MASNRFLIVPVDSSAARMPRPGATMAVATLFSSLKFIAPSSTCSTSRSLAPFRLRGALRNQQYLHAGQRLAFQRFKEGAAACRNMRHALLDRSDIERGHRVAASRKADKLPGGGEFRGRLGDLDCTIVERLMLEGTEWAVPDQGLAARQNRDDMFD